MKTVFFKIFLSKRSEEKWLNSMGENGYLLTNVNDSRYSFDFSEKCKYYYSIQYLDVSPKSDKADEYYQSLARSNIKPLVTSGNWVYFSKEDEPIQPSVEVYKKNSTPYFWRMLYMLFFALCGAVVCGYQAFAIGFLERVGHEGRGLIETTYEISNNAGLFNKLLNVLKFIGNTFFRMLNAYFELWTNVFGESNAVSVIAIVAPITVVLLILGALNFERYFTYRTLINKLENGEGLPFEQTGGAVNAKQDI